MPSFSTQLQRSINAAPQALWDAWTRAAGWNSWFTTGARIDLRLGGSFSNDDQDSGTYLLLEPPRRLRFSWNNPHHQPGSRVSISISPLPPSGRGAARSRIRLRHSGLASPQEAADLYMGWSWALDSLKSFVETGRAISDKDWIPRDRRRRA